MEKFKAPYVRHPAERSRVQFTCVGESRTHQSHAEACDINSIIRRFDNTGLLPDGRPGGQFADVSKFAGKSTAEHLMESRDVLRETASILEAKALEEKSKAEAKTKADAEELENFRKEKAEKPITGD